jgi:hypothetical protein
MASIFDSSIVKQESEWFTSQTNLYDSINTARYRICPKEKEALKNQIFGTKSTLLRPSKHANDSLALEHILRNCFNKCSKFVLEDWVDYNEVDCTTKCASLNKAAYEILKTSNF